jgi:hypothetical protein
MSLPARAIYLDLLFQIYEYGGSIPSDRGQLLKLTMSTLDEFESAWPEISKHIVPVEGDPSRLTNLAAKARLEKQALEYQASQEAGRRGGRPRKGVGKGLAKGSDNHSEAESDSEEEAQKETELTCAPDGARVSDSSFLSPRTNMFPARQGDGQQEEWFERFWSAYWRKVARLPAQAAFCKLVLTEETFQAVMKGLGEQREAMMARIEQHRPHATSWLEGQRWLDEPPVDPMDEAIRRRYDVIDRA